VSFVLGQLCVAHMQSFLQERPYATAYWPFSVVESCTSNLNPLASHFIKNRYKILAKKSAL
ncbi:hypothetical protein, partial [Neisseria dumasiana]|uniref:hypothetical protein n=1 Tax=Neisseria dumasiana TaxID=1931275 RepID=UPI001C5BCD71